jgi:hypothetical protein
MHVKHVRNILLGLVLACVIYSARRLPWPVEPVHSPAPSPSPSSWLQVHELPLLENFSPPKSPDSIIVYNNSRPFTKVYIEVQRGKWLCIDLGTQQVHARINTIPQECWNGPTVGVPWY